MANDQTMRLRSNLAQKKCLSNKKTTKTKVKSLSFNGRKNLINLRSTPLSYFYLFSSLWDLQSSNSYQSCLINDIYFYLIDP